MWQARITGRRAAYLIMRAVPNDSLPPMAPSRPASTERPSSAAFDADVLVMDGAPAGGTTATLLARQDWRMRLLEKDRPPRFHIGESLLPMNLPILRRLGVPEAVAALVGHFRGLGRRPVDDFGSPINCRLAWRRAAPALTEAG